MRLLHVTPAYYPATYWGGPIWSTKAICDGMAAKTDVTLRVLTTDSAGPAISERATPVDLPYPVHYARRWAGHSIAPALLRQLPQAMRWADVVHLTAVYNMPTLPVFALARLLGKPLIWSPRGALQATQDWQEAPKRFAKQRFERMLNTIRPAKMLMHVTAPQEAATSMVHFPGVATQVIPNAVDVPATVRRSDRPIGRTRLIFLGRLHPKKGIDELIAALARLPGSFSLDIYGDGDAAYLAELKRAAASCAGRVCFHGHVGDADKAAAFEQADLFVLPSHSENFGIAVAEALAHGVPVLTTQATPWQALASHECGRCIDMQTDDLGNEIAVLAAQDLAAMGLRGRVWMQRDFSGQSMVASFDRLYRDMIAPSLQEALA